MLKKILKLQGVVQLEKGEQKTIKGGLSHMPPGCTKHADCPPGYCCNEVQTGNCTLGGACR